MRISWLKLSHASNEKSLLSESSPSDPTACVNLENQNKKILKFLFSGTSIKNWEIVKIESEDYCIEETLRQCSEGILFSEIVTQSWYLYEHSFCQSNPDFFFNENTS